LRATALFTPTDTLKLQVMYQRRRQSSTNFDQVVGTGSPGFAALGIAAKFNGPALNVGDRKSVEDAPSINYNNIDLITANATWQVLGHQLSYNYGRQSSFNLRNSQSQDTGSVLPGFEVTQSYVNATAPKFFTHEIRLSSEPRAGRLLDYAIGFFQKHSDGVLDLTNPVYLPGAFGAPFVTPPGGVTTPINPYVLTARTKIGIGQVYDSFYANVKVHIDSKTELSIGGRHIRDRVPVTLDVATSSASVAYARFLPAASGGCPSPFLPNSAVYGSSYCDATVPASTSSTPYNNVYNKNIYSVSLSHRFSSNILAYATTGSSYRSGLPAIGNTGLPAGALTPRPETANSYELGLKTNWNHHIRINADVFQIDYKDQLTQFANTPYYNSVSGSTSYTSAAFFGNVDAKVQGFEIESAVRPFENFNLGANLSYAKITSKGGSVPCTGTAALTAANPLNYCASASKQTLNASPMFQASVNGSYSHPIGPLDGYVRFNASFQGSNPNYGTSNVATGAYTLVDLFAGVTGRASDWELGLYAKNVFNAQVLLTSQAISNSVYPLFAAPVGYSKAMTTLPREVGITFRYAFGSR
jgi:iron complex outermembrane receptor protein